jgi:hypothetical protein
MTALVVGMLALKLIRLTGEAGQCEESIIVGW